MPDIAIVTRAMQRGGAERVIRHLLQYLLDRGWTAELILMEDRPVEYELPDGCAVSTIGTRSKNALINKFFQYRALRRAVVRRTPDLVLAMPEEIGIYAVLALLGTRIPVAVSERNDPRRMPNKRITRLLRRIAYPLANGLIFQTAGARAYFPKRIRERGVILENPLDTDRLIAPWTGAREKRIAFVGRLEQQKNVPLLLHAFAAFLRSHEDYVLELYGAGRLDGELKALAATLLPDGAYRFCGSCADVCARIRTAGMFVLPSDHEGMPNALIEAMAMGLPCIVTNCPSGGPASLIQDGENGLLVPVGDADALRSAMARIADDGAFAARLGERAQSVRERLSLETVGAEWARFFQDMTQKRGVKRYGNGK